MERIWARRGYLGAHRKPEVGISSAVCSQHGNFSFQCTDFCFVPSDCPLKIKEFVQEGYRRNILPQPVSDFSSLGSFSSTPDCLISFTHAVKIHRVRLMFFVVARPAKG